jgi:hypothetical protein
MVAYVFDTILTKGVRAGQIPARTQQARTWFRTEAEKTNITPTRVVKQATLEGKSVAPSTLEIGEMYLFNYDPKHKKTLPYYDTFPLVFPIDSTPDGFLGLNLHYLPLRQRAILMDALYGLVSDQKYDSNTRLRLSYNLLKNASKYKLFKPTIKRYLRSKIKSRFVRIEPVEWDMALFMPLQKFSKASQEKVWQDSLKKVS